VYVGLPSEVAVQMMEVGSKPSSTAEDKSVGKLALDELNTVLD